MAMVIPAGTAKARSGTGVNPDLGCLLTDAYRSNGMRNGIERENGRKRTVDIGFKIEHRPTNSLRIAPSITGRNAGNTASHKSTETKNKRQQENEINSVYMQSS